MVVPVNLAKIADVDLSATYFFKIKIESNLMISHWSLVIGHWSLVINDRSLFMGHCSLVIGCNQLMCG